MIIIERIERIEVQTWDDARKELSLAGILLPDYEVKNIEAGRPLTMDMPSYRRTPGQRLITVRYEPDADR